MGKLFYRCGYSNPNGDTKTRLHQSRDGTAFNELADALYGHGYRYGTFIHNYANHCLPAQEFAFLNGGDIVACTTRPPMDDFYDEIQEAGKKDWRIIRRSNDDLEKAIFQELRVYFTHVSRNSTILSPLAQKLLSPQFADHASITYHTRGKATIGRLETSRAGRPVSLKAPNDFNSMGFFLHLPRIGVYPCGMVVSFSMGGYENLLWNRIVRLKYDKWLKQPTFACALLNLRAEPTEPLTPKLADDAPVKILIEHAI